MYATFSSMNAARTEGTRSRQPGDRIARKLELVRKLGEGGMGTLWVARNLTTHAEVAIKVLRSHREDDGHAAERFRHEARLGAMLAHRNITRVFDLLEDDDGSLVLVMELLHGVTLESAYKAKGAFSNEEAVAIMVPILGALQHAHEHGVLHRDVKPSNIFLHVDPDGHTTPKLLDFGIAKANDASVLTRTGEALGSPSYMSPEQVRANKRLDGRSDLFSVGAVLYEIITGANPFDAPSPTAVLAQVLELEVDPDPLLEPRVWLEVQRALSKQAYERHPSASSLAEALSRAVGLAPPDSVRGVRIALANDGPRSERRLVPMGLHEREHETHDALLAPVGPVGPVAPVALVADEATAPESREAAESTAAHELPVRTSRSLLVVLACAAALVLVTGVGLVVRSSRSGGPPTAPTVVVEPMAPATASPAFLDEAAPRIAVSAPAVSAPAVSEVPPEASGSSSHTGAPASRPRVRPAVAPRPAGATPAKAPASSAPSIARTPGF